MGTEKGVLKIVNEEQIFSDKFKKKEFIIETLGQYPKPIIFQLVNDKTSLINSFSIGQEIEVSYNLNGKEWLNKSTNEIKYFNTLDAWKIDATLQSTSEKLSAIVDRATIADEVGDSLPF